MPPTLKKKTAISALWEAAIDTLLPPRCVATGEIVDVQGMVSPAFWSQLQFIEDPFCQTCGIPFSFEIANDSFCAACMEREPLFDQSRSAVTYNEASRKLVLSFKYGDRLHSVHTFPPPSPRHAKRPQRQGTRPECPRRLCRERPSSLPPPRQKYPAG